MAGIVETSPGAVAFGERFSPSVLFSQTAHGSAIGAATTSTILDASGQTLQLDGPTDDFLLEQLSCMIDPVDSLTGVLASVFVFLNVAGLGASNAHFPVNMVPFVVSNTIKGTLQFFAVVPKRISWRQLQNFLSTVGGLGTHGPISFSIRAFYTVTNPDGVVRNFTTQMNASGRKIEGSEVD